MERTIKCFKFQTNRLTKCTAIFTVVYIALYFFMLLIFSLQTQKETTNMCYFVTAIFLAFILPSVLYKNTFNNLLMFGNTRRTILTSFFLCTAAFSAALAVLSELGELFNSGMSHIFKSIKNPVLFYIYGSINAPQKLLWFFTLFFMIVMLGFVYGALSYKFGKTFRIVFWSGFGLLSMLTSLLTIGSIYTAVVNGFKSFFGYQMSNGVYWCSLHFLIVAAILGVILWLLARRQPQNA